MGYAPAEKMAVSRNRIPHGGAMIDGIRYFLGRNITREANQGDLRVHKILETMAGITQRDEQGEEGLAYIFNLTDSNDSRLNRVRTTGRNSARHTFYYQANKEVSDPRKYNQEEFQTRRPDEKLADYQKRLRAVDDFKFLLRLGADLSRRANVDLIQLNAQEQHWLVQAVRAKKGNYEAVVNLAEKYGLSGLKSFLSLEYGAEMGGRIMAIAENLDQETAQAVFDRYFEIVDAVEKARDYLLEQVDQVGNEQTVDEIVKNLLQRSRQFLADFSQETQKAKLGQRKINSQDILARLANIKTEILLFASAFKALAGKQTVDLRDIKDTEIQITPAVGLKPADKETMKKIFTQNRPGYSKSLLKKTLTEFSAALESADKIFYLLRHQGEMAAFVRFDELPEGRLYAGSLNVRPEIKGSAIGSAMLKAALETEGREQVIEAVVYEKNPMMKHYIDDFGFKVVGEILDYHGTGEKFYHLERPPTL
ncbi:MAG: GNAT family N-acetyltransferase [Patescibacteria group bacterium]